MRFSETILPFNKKQQSGLKKTGGLLQSLTTAAAFSDQQPTGRSRAYTQHLWRQEFRGCRSASLEQSTVSAASGLVGTSATDNNSNDNWHFMFRISVGLTDHDTAWLFNCLRIRNTITYLLAYLLTYLLIIAIRRLKFYRLLTLCLSIFLSQLSGSSWKFYHRCICWRWKKND